MKTPNSLTTLLRKYHVLHLATGHQNVIQSAPLFYAVAENGRDLIFVSANTSAHMCALRTQSTLALSISPAKPTIEMVEGIQAHGQLLCEGPTQTSLRAQYLARFPAAEPLLSATSDHELHLIRLTWARLITPLSQRNSAPTEWTFADQ